MKQIANIGGKDLRGGQIEVFQQIKAGKPIGNPMAIRNANGSVITKLDDIKPTATGSTVADNLHRRFWKAIRRDAYYCTAGAPFIRAFGMRQSVREINDLAIEQQKAGTPPS